MRLEIAALFLGLATATGCSFHYSPPEIRSSSGFPGLWDALAQSEEADFLYVHGMCNHDVKDVVDIFTTIGGSLGMTLEAPPEKEDIGDYGGEFYRARLKGSGRTLHAHAIVWSPVTKTAKRGLCYDAKGGNAICKESEAADVGRRAVLNQQLKRVLLDECLADAIYYSGKEGHRAVEQSIERGLMHAIGREIEGACRAPLVAESVKIRGTPLVVYTESLSSKMLFDAVREADGCTSRLVARWMERSVQIFMGANQLPMLALADEQTDRKQGISADDAPPAIQPLVSLLRRTQPLSIADEKKLGRRMVVAFSDPNDLLSFTLQPYAGAVKDVEFIDVLVSNAGEWIRTVESPYPAHTTYRSNPDVRRLIACGSRGRDRDCPPLPPMTAH